MTRLRELAHHVVQLLAVLVAVVLIPLTGLVILNAFEVAVIFILEHATAPMYILSVPPLMWAAWRYEVKPS